MAPKKIKNRLSIELVGQSPNSAQKTTVRAHLSITIEKTQKIQRIVQLWILLVWSITRSISKITLVSTRSYEEQSRK